METCKKIIFGGHSFHPFWDPKSFLAENDFLDLIEDAYKFGIRCFDVTYEAEVQVLGYILNKCEHSKEIGVGCLQSYLVTSSASQQMEQLSDWLKLLGRTSLKYLYIFPPPNEAQTNELKRQKSKGLFQKLGLWIRSSDEKVDTDLFDFVAGIYNPLNLELTDRFKKLHEKGCGVVILESLGGGALLARCPERQRTKLARALLQFSLGQPWCDAVILTMRNKKELSANLEAARDGLKDDLDILKDINNFYSKGYSNWVNESMVFNGWDGEFPTK